MANPDYTLLRGAPEAVAANKVLKNTYLLLAATLGFSALTAMLSMALHMPPMVYMGAVLVSMVLGIFVLPKTANSSAGIGVIFLITGLLGFGLGAILSIYLALPHGPETVAMAFGGTAAIFLGLSGYALTTRRDFSFLGGFVFAGMMVLLIAMLANLFFAIPALSLAISAAMILLMSAMILWDTSRIARGEETNYIMATYSIYLSIFNLFISLLQLLGILGDD
ncbi:Bax inhibitor-1/YccA family protein [Candidatus Thiodictyon syntrophicum]|jgi:modulator of FtsH protease|uniref:BAX inhibitor protein n=1 Tax=Candidatus Thiodictyon syntrophicum TaxID=1166950 RepID=A0A2K8U887_9GAMM|nr:Bax inhibitor-1/YccA family protein [Candidatus Thiodictyon syntrophicum]AUB81818.1 BAX inhibitor protein [Candidatus Thiodictyon syntrophicum]